MNPIADISLALASGYVAVGLAVGLWFIIRHLPATHPAAAPLGASVRLVLLPAAVGLWPLMLALSSARHDNRWQPASTFRPSTRQHTIHHITWLVLAPTSVALILTAAALSHSSLPLATPARSAGKAPQP